MFAGYGIIGHPSVPRREVQGMAVLSKVTSSTIACLVTIVCFPSEYHLLRTWAAACRSAEAAQLRRGVMTPNFMLCKTYESHLVRALLLHSGICPSRERRRYRYLPRREGLAREPRSREVHGSAAVLHFGRNVPRCLSSPAELKCENGAGHISGD